MPTKYTAKDARSDTNSSRRETSAAWHQAREDYRKDPSCLDNRGTSDWKDSAPKGDSSSATYGTPGNSDSKSSSSDKKSGK